MTSNIIDIQEKGVSPLAKNVPVNLYDSVKI